MGYQENLRFSNNWWIREQTTKKLRDQAETGWFNRQERIYIGDTRKLELISGAFREIADTCQSPPRMFVRRSCLDEISQKYTLVEFYLSEETEENRRVREATWTAPVRLRDNQIVETINEQFEPILEENEFNPPKPLFTEGFDAAKS